MYKKKEKNEIGEWGRGGMIIPYWMPILPKPMPYSDDVEHQQLHLNSHAANSSKPTKARSSLSNNQA